MKYVITSSFILLCCTLLSNAIDLEDMNVAAERLKLTSITDTTKEQTNIQYKDACIQLGKALTKQQKYKDALEYYKKALLVDPHDPEIYYAIGNTLRYLKYIDLALDAYQKAYKLNPNHLNTLVELANTYNLIDKPQEALALYLKALEQKPQTPKLAYNIAFTLKKLGYLDKAIVMYRRAIELQPDYALAHYSLGLAELTFGNFDHGFENYQWRSYISAQIIPPFTQPIWNGDSLSNKTLLVYADSDACELFLFIRYISLIKASDNHIIIMAPTEFKTILEQCSYIDQVLTLQDQPPSFDVHIPLRALPIIHKTSPETIPAPIPYITIDQTLCTTMNAHLSRENNTINVGIYWKNKSYRELSLSHFAPLASLPHVRLISLQQIDNTILTSQSDIIINDLGKYASSQDPVIYRYDQLYELSDYTHMASFIKNLDLIICIDCEIAHLAGALAIPTWVLLGKQASWQWMTYRTDSPWYPTIRLFRYTNADSLNTTMQTIAQELTAITENPVFKPCSAQDLFDHVTYYRAMMNITNNQIIKHTVQHIVHTLHASCQTYLQKYPSLNTYVNQLSAFNEQLINIEKQLSTTPFCSLNGNHIDLARKACYAHDVKQDIKNRIKQITTES